MKLLLDTHTILWLVEGSPKLSAVAKTALANPANELFLSGIHWRSVAIRLPKLNTRLSALRTHDTRSEMAIYTAVLP